MGSSCACFLVNHVNNIKTKRKEIMTKVVAERSIHNQVLKSFKEGRDLWYEWVTETKEKQQVKFQMS